MPKLDLWPVLETLYIKPKNAKLKRLAKNDLFSWAQRQLVAEIERQYNAGLPVRIILCKGRQLGCSTITAATMFLWSFLHEGSNGIVLSRENDEAEYLFNMIRLFWEKGPLYDLFRTRYYTQSYVEWDGISSTITAETTKKADVGRGRTIHTAHCSEVGFWERADDMVPSLMNAVPYEHGTIVILESTPNGVGNYFHETWQDATFRTNEFVPMFFPWFLHDEYEVKKTTLSFADLDDDEKGLLGRYPEMNLPKLAWRRRKIAELPQREAQFMREYPCSPQEGFLHTGRNVFPLEKVEEIYKPDVGQVRGMLYNADGKIDFAETKGGHLTVYQWPDPTRRQQYVVAVDPTWTLEGDPCCIQVLNRASLEQCAVWHGHADPRTIGEISLGIAYYYHRALLNTEVQGGGKVVMEVWRNENYPNIWVDRRPDAIRRFKAVLGIYMSHEVKATVLGTMIGAFQRRQCVIHHPPTYHQICNYISLGTGAFGPARRSGEDDCVMSFGIGLYTALTEMGNLDFLAAYGAQRDAPALPGARPPGRPHIAGDYGTAVDPLSRVRVATNPILSDLDEFY